MSKVSSTRDVKQGISNFLGIVLRHDLILISSNLARHLVIASLAIFGSTTSFAQPDTIAYPTLTEAKVDVPLGSTSVNPKVQSNKAMVALRHALTKNNDRQVRKIAATSLGNIKDIESAKHLTRMLNDASPAVRRACYSALLKIGQPAVPYLSGALKHRKPLVRRLAASLLSKIGRQSPQPRSRTVTSMPVEKAQVSMKVANNASLTAEDTIRKLTSK
jgi:HEAT repeat protein